MNKPVKRTLMSDREFLYQLDRKILYYGHHITNLADPEMHLDNAVELMRIISRTSESFSLAVICRIVRLGSLKYDETHTRVSALNVSSLEGGARMAEGEIDPLRIRGYEFTLEHGGVV